MNTLKRIEGGLVRLEKALLVALVAFMVALSFLQVILRGVFSAGLLWGDTLLRHLVLWVGFLGAALATVGRRQFAMDAFVKLLPAPRRRRVKAAVDAVSAAVCLLLFFSARSFLKDEMASPSSLFTAGGAAVPAWAIELILPAGFILLLLHTLLRLAEELTGTAPPERAEPAEIF